MRQPLIGIMDRDMVAVDKIGVEGSAHASGLHIIDPPAKDDFKVTEDQMVFADDAIARAVGARSLRLAGFPEASSALSAPTGRYPNSRPSQGRQEEVRRETVAAKRARAEEELRIRSDRERFSSRGETYRGRKVEIALPAPVWIGRRSSSSIIARYGMGVKFLDELRGRPLADNLIQEAIPAFLDLQPGTTLDSDARGARLRIGQSFIADIDFRR